MKKQLFFVFIFFNSLFIFSQEKSIPEKKTQKGFLTVDFLSIDMPTNDLGIDEEHMGFTGIHYNISFKFCFISLVLSRIGSYCLI